MSYDTARPYLATFVLLRKDNKVAFVKRKNTGWMDGYYSLPAGKSEVGERAYESAVREALEEVGVTIKESNLHVAHVCHRKSDDDTLAWIDVLFEVDTWQGDPYNAEPEKSSEFTWLDLDSLPENIVPSQRYELEQIRDGNSFSEFNW